MYLHSCPCRGALRAHRTRAWAGVGTAACRPASRLGAAAGLWAALSCACLVTRYRRRRSASCPAPLRPRSASFPSHERASRRSPSGCRPPSCRSPRPQPAARQLLRRAAEGQGGAPRPPKLPTPAQDRPPPVALTRRHIPARRAAAHARRWPASSRRAPPSCTDGNDSARSSI